jgi:hypothetical protein|tara:strand:- start:1287 stop:1427 length:141 start_codon:yes stop_codon:yes gene_type:complete
MPFESGITGKLSVVDPVNLKKEITILVGEVLPVFHRYKGTGMQNQI